MNYMERRGSGFKKIKRDYAASVNYTEEKTPKFYSTASSFFVTLYNLNYEEVADKVTDKVTNKVTDKFNATQKKLLSYIEMNPDATTSDMMAYMMMSESGIKKNLRILRDNGNIERVGSKKTGHWIILKQ